MFFKLSNFNKYDNMQLWAKFLKKESLYRVQNYFKALII